MRYHPAVSRASDLGRRAFVISGASAAAACHSLPATQLPPSTAKFVEELEAAVDRLPELTPFTASARDDEDPEALRAADASLQRTMHTLLSSATFLDIEPEHRADPRVMAIAERAKLSANRSTIDSMWSVDDMLADPDDPTLAALDANPREVLEAASFIDEAAQRAGFPRRWRRRMRRVAKELAWRIERQSARAVVSEAWERANRGLERRLGETPDPFAEAIAEASRSPRLVSLDLSGLDFGAPPDDRPAVQRPSATPQPPTPAPATTPASAPTPAPTPAPAPAPTTPPPSGSPTPPVLPDPGGSTVPEPGPAPEPAPAPVPATDPTAPSTTAPTLGDPTGGAPPSTMAPALGVEELEPVDSPGPGVIDVTDPSLMHRYAGHWVVLYRRGRGPHTTAIGSGVLAGIDGRGRIVLLQSAYARAKIHVSLVGRVDVGDAEPGILRRAHASAMAMVVAGSIMVPIGLGFAFFTLGASLFLFCPGLVILIIGAIRLRQVRDGYRVLRSRS